MLSINCVYKFDLWIFHMYKGYGYMCGWVGKLNGEGK